MDNLVWFLKEYWWVIFTAALVSVFMQPVLKAALRGLTGRELPRKPSTPRPECPPAPARKRVKPVVLAEDFWMPTKGIPRREVEWKCEYCGTVNRDVATCHHCGAPCTVSEKVEKIREIGKVGGCPFPPPE